MTSKTSTNLNIAPFLSPKQKRSLSILAALASPDASVADVAAAHHVTEATVRSVVRRARDGELKAEKKGKLPLDEALTEHSAEVVAEVVQTSVADAISWCGEVRSVGQRAVRFLNRALDEGNVDPRNHNHVRVVGESVLRVLAEVLRLNWLMTTARNEGDLSPLRRDIASLDDTQLEAEARAALDVVSRGKS